ncbi:MAG: hypothetical protein GC179_11170 [Anaerolineaceae bacterium]|nr:hypothetical protein [Anaerolineaceae bacterium]
MKNYLIWVIAMTVLLPSSIFAQNQANSQQSVPNITSLVWNPDGTKIAASFDNETVKVWGINPASSRLMTPPLLTFHPDIVDSIKWTSDGKFLISEGKIADGKGEIQLTIAKWDSQNGQFVEDLFDYHIKTHFKFNTVAYNIFPVVGFDSTYNRSAFSMNSRMVAISDNSDFPPVFFVDRGVVQKVSWSPNDSILAVIYGGTDTYNVQTFNVATGELINNIWGPDYGVHSLAWSSDNSLLAVESIWLSVASATSIVRLYSISKGNDYLSDGDTSFPFELTQISSTYKRLYPAMVWHPKVNILAISYAESIDFYRVPNKQPVKTILAENIVSLTYSPDGKHLAGSDPEGNIKIWDVSDLVGVEAK